MRKKKVGGIIFRHCTCIASILFFPILPMHMCREKCAEIKMEHIEREKQQRQQQQKKILMQNCNQNY